MHDVRHVGLILLLADLPGTALVIGAFFSKLGYERIPPDPKDKLDFKYRTAHYRVFGRHLRLYIHLTVGVLIIGAALFGIGFL